MSWKEVHLVCAGRCADARARACAYVYGIAVSRALRTHPRARSTRCAPCNVVSAFGGAAQACACGCVMMCDMLGTALRDELRHCLLSPLRVHALIHA